MHSLFVSVYEFTARLFPIPHEEVEMLMPRLFLGSPKRRCLTFNEENDPLPFNFQDYFDCRLQLAPNVLRPTFKCSYSPVET